MATPATINEAFTVEVNGTDNPVEEVDVGGSSVTLVVQNRLAFGDTITVTYEPPTTSKITDRFGNALAAFTDQTVDNELPDPNDTDPPVFDGAETDSEGLEISISFDEDIEASIPPNMPVELALLDDRPDPVNEHRYILEFRWSPGIENDQTERDYYEYRIREVTTPVTAWPAWTRTEAGTVSIDNLPPNRMYQFQVRAVNLGGPSAPESITVPTPTVVAGLPLLGFEVTSKGRKLDGTTYKYFMEFAYSRDPADGGPFTRFEYRHKKTADAGWGAWVANGSNTTFEIDTFDRNTSYDIEARQVNFIGASTAVSLTETVTFNVPSDLEDFQVSGSRAGESGSYTYPLQLDFQPGSADDTNTLDKFRYRYKLDSASNFGSWVDVDKDARSVVITGLTHTVGYDVEFEPVNSAGSGTKQTVDNYMIFTKPDPVSELTGVDFETGPVGGRINNVIWTWRLNSTDPTKTIDDVLTRVREQPAAFGAFVSKGATAISQTETNLTGAAKHEIEIKTKNSAGESAVLSHVVDVKVLDPGPRLELNNFNGSTMSVTVSLVDISKVKFIEFEYRANAQSNWGPVSRGGPTTSPFYIAYTGLNQQGEPDEFYFLSPNFEFGYVTGAGFRVRGVGESPGYAPATLWREGIIPAIRSASTFG